ncbi:MAG: hypothetical protein IPG92_13920 [Flavobacteriales bacterium]|nr:hypothetical protein [Flavobacteriales bacterium]
MRASFLLASCALAAGASAFNIQLTPYPETCGNGNGYVTVYIDGPAMEPLRTLGRTGQMVRSS